jgi:hypothetical protein
MANRPAIEQVGVVELDNTDTFDERNSTINDPNSTINEPNSTIDSVRAALLASRQFSESYVAELQRREGNPSFCALVRAHRAAGGSCGIYQRRPISRTLSSARRAKRLAGDRLTRYETYN